jgi:hypothetical protein
MVSPSVFLGRGVLTLNFYSVSTSGIAISAIIQFFAVQFHSVNIDWVGNDTPYNGCDGAGCPLKTLAHGEHFGPVRIWFFAETSFTLMSILYDLSLGCR